MINQEEYRGMRHFCIIETKSRHWLCVFIEKQPVDVKETREELSLTTKVDKEGYATQNSSEERQSMLSSATLKLVYLLKPQPQIGDERNRRAVNSKWMFHQNVAHLN